MENLPEPNQEPYFRGPLDMGRFAVKVASLAAADAARTVGAVISSGGRDTSKEVERFRIGAMVRRDNLDEYILDNKLGTPRLQAKAAERLLM